MGDSYCGEFFEVFADTLVICTLSGVVAKLTKEHFGSKNKLRR